MSRDELAFGRQWSFGCCNGVLDGVLGNRYPDGVDAWESAVGVTEREDSERRKDLRRAEEQQLDGTARWRNAVPTSDRRARRRIWLTPEIEAGTSALAGPNDHERRQRLYCRPRDGLERHPLKDRANHGDFLLGHQPRSRRTHRFSPTTYRSAANAVVAIERTTAASSRGPAAGGVAAQGRPTTEPYGVRLLQRLVGSAQRREMTKLCFPELIASNA